MAKRKMTEEERKARAREYQRNYYAKNKEKLREKSRERYRENKEAILERQKNYYSESECAASISSCRSNSSAPARLARNKEA